MKIGFIAQENNTGWYSHAWRFNRLVSAINNHGLHQAYMMFSQEIVRNPELPIEQDLDIVIFQSELAGVFLSIIQHWKAYQITVIADIHHLPFEEWDQSNGRFKWETGGLIPRRETAS